MLLDAVKTTSPVVVNEMKMSGVIAPESAMRVPDERCAIENGGNGPLLGTGSVLESCIVTCAAGFAAGMSIVPPYVPPGPKTVGRAVALGTVSGVNCPGCDASWIQLGCVPT